MGAQNTPKNKSNLSKQNKLKQNNTKGDFQNIKDISLLKNIFKYIKRHKLLEIVRYNKKAQKKLEISINDFKEYSNNIPIEIEIIPKISISGNFINIPKEDNSYYHIYFNNDIKEIKKNYINDKDKVAKIKIFIDYQVLSFSELFKDCKCIESINFIKFHRNNINDMSYMFCRCTSLKKLELSHFNTENVTNMSCMFFECCSLKYLNLSKFNTKNVVDMSSIFQGCSSLKELDLSNFNTTKVQNMIYMFCECKELKQLNLSNFITYNTIKMGSMFQECLSLKQLDISNFNTINVVDFSNMFQKCTSLTNLPYIRNISIKSF